MTDEAFYDSKANDRSEICGSAEDNAFQTVREEFGLASPFAYGMGTHPEAEARFYEAFRGSYEFLQDIS